MKIVFMGTPDFAVTAVDAIAKAGHEIVLVVTQPDQPKGRGKTLTPPPVKEWAMEHGIPVFQPERIKRPEAIEELKKYPADIFVVAAFGQILPPAVLEMPPYGCVNIHASLLPKYRGAAPIQWAVINGDAKSGVTTMQMGPGLDDGDILMTREVTISPEETGGSLFDRLAVLGGELIIDTLTGLENHMITPIPQKEEDATHVGMIAKSLGRMDFSRPAKELECLIRGLNPWPSAYTYYQGKMLKIWKADVASGKGQPGNVLVSDGKQLIVACGEDALSLKEVQLEGKKRMPVEDFLRGCRIPEGIGLGE